MTVGIFSRDSFILNCSHTVDNTHRHLQYDVEEASFSLQTIYTIRKQTSGETETPFNGRVVFLYFPVDYWRIHNYGTKRLSLKIVARIHLLPRLRIY